MKKYLFIFLCGIAFAQTEIRSLNGSLNNSQRLAIDTTSSATFKWLTSNGVHTLYLPYRIVNPSSGSFLWNVSGQTRKSDSLRLIAGSGISLTQSGNTVTLATYGGGSVGNADSLGGLPASYYFKYGQNTKYVSQSYSGYSDPYYTTIQSAINASDSGTTIFVYSGTYDSIQVNKKYIAIIGIGSSRYDSASGSFIGGVIIRGTSQGGGMKGLLLNNLAFQRTTSAGDVYYCGVSTSVSDTIIDHTYLNCKFAGSAYNNAYHAFLAQYGGGITISNCSVYRSSHGFALRAKNINANNLYIEDCGSESGIIIKSDLGSGDAININISNVIIRSTGATTRSRGIVITAENSTKFTQNINISNVTMYRVAGAGVFTKRYTGTLTSISLSNIYTEASGSAGFAFDNNDASSFVTVSNSRTLNATTYGFLNSSAGKVVLSNCVSQFSASGDTSGQFVIDGLIGYTGSTWTNYGTIALDTNIFATYYKRGFLAKKDIDSVGTISKGTWNGTILDTAYSNSVATVTGAYGITATRYNTKDIQIKIDSATLRSKFVPYTGANASVDLGAQTLTTAGQITTTVTSGTGFRELSSSTTIGDSAGLMFGMQGASTIGGGIWAKNVSVTGGSRSHSLTLYSYNQSLGGKVLNLTLNPDGTTSASGKFSSGGLTSSGAFGMANIVDTVTYATASSSIAAKNLTATAGLYRITYYLALLTTGTGGTVAATLSYNNGTAQTVTSASILLTVSGGVAQDVVTYYVASGTPTIKVDVTGGTGSPVYRFDAIVERLK